MFKKAYDFMIAVAALFFAGALLANNVRAQQTPSFHYVMTDLTSYFVSDNVSKYCPQFDRGYRLGKGPRLMLEGAMASLNDDNRPAFSMASDDAIAASAVQGKNVHDSLMPLANIGSRYSYAIVANTSPLARIDDLGEKNRVMTYGDISTNSFLTFSTAYGLAAVNYKTFDGTAADALRQLLNGEADVLYVSGMEPDMEFVSVKLDSKTFRFLRLDVDMARPHVFNRFYTPRSYESSKFAGRQGNVIESRNVLFTTKISYAENKNFYYEMTGCLINHKKEIRSNAHPNENNLWRTFDMEAIPKYSGITYNEWEAEMLEKARSKAAPKKKTGKEVTL